MNVGTLIPQLKQADPHDEVILMVEEICGDGDLELARPESRDDRSGE